MRIMAMSSGAQVGNFGSFRMISRALVQELDHILNRQASITHSHSLFSGAKAARCSVSDLAAPFFNLSNLAAVLSPHRFTQHFNGADRQDESRLSNTR
jgi:hypothetical protein